MTDYAVYTPDGGFDVDIMLTPKGEGDEPYAVDTDHALALILRRRAIRRRSRFGVDK